MGPKNALLWLEFEKAITVSEIITLKFLKNESLTHTVNLVIRSAFSKGPGSGFSEGPPPGPGPIFKYNPQPKGPFWYLEQK